MIASLRSAAVLVVSLHVAVLSAAEPDARQDASTEAVEVKPESLRVSFALPKRGDARTLSLGESAAEFHVVLTNISSEPVRLWKEWCSWGYFNLTFELEFDDEKPVPVEKTERGWDKNFPDFVEIPPGEHFVLPVRLTADVWKFDFVKRGGAEPRRARLRAVYAVEPDDQSRAHGVWTGRVESHAIEVMLHDQRK